MADISNITTPDNNLYHFKDAASRENIQNIIGRNDYFEKYLSDIVGFTYMTRGYSQTTNGITVETSPDKLKIYGTATSQRYLCFLNGQNFVKGSGNDFSKTLGAGKYLIESDITGYQSLYAFRGTYATFADDFTIVNGDSKTAIVEFTAPVMLGLLIINGRNYGTVEDPTYVSFSAQRVLYSDADNTSY